MYNNVFAWDFEGHGVIGILAVNQLQPEARLRLDEILGDLEEATLIKACNWPDAVRETAEWDWSEPLHYVNLPRGEARYSAARDCPEQQCVTEAIKDYAGVLGNPAAGGEERRQAFAWLCHFTADIHHPLHAGYADDRGGNTVDVTFDGESMDLHEFWDRALIEHRVGDLEGLLTFLNTYHIYQRAGENWSESMVDDWTEESHQLVETVVYPPNSEIGHRYEEESWGLVQHRILTASSRLALIINTVLSDQFATATLAEPFSFRSSTGLEIFGDHYAADTDSRGVILLFHQGGSNARAEYASVIPRLLEWHYEVYAFDMRAGGDRLGGENRTIVAMGGEDDADYCDVYPDFEAVLAYVSNQSRSPLILWGSSYSGALVFQLASRHTSDIRAVLGFSPASGGPMERCRPGLYLEGISMPAIAFRPAHEMGRPSTDNQKLQFEAAGIPFHVIENAVHGSSMLNPARIDGDVTTTWKIVEDFLSALRD
jgi:hypothetical protein